MKRFLYVLFGCAIVATSSAGPVSQAFQQYFQNNTINANKKYVNDSIKTQTFKQLINHEQPLKGFFDQRFYIDDTFSWGKNSPVFLYICGERECKSNVLYGAIRDYAKKFGARLVALEHRYYGESLPYETFSVENLKELNILQAVDDIAYFQNSMIQENGWTGDWVAFGGSYAGTLSAFYRVVYPELTVGSIASSAPVYALEDFQAYDAIVASVLNEKGCLYSVIDVQTDIEDAILDGDNEKLDYYKFKFKAQDIAHNLDFIYYVADMAASAVQYGMANRLCSLIDNADDPLDGYAEFADSITQMFGLTPLELTFGYAITEDPKAFRNIGMRQWAYQSCTEFGFWQNSSHPRSFSARSRLINAEYHHDVCKRLFAMEDGAGVEKTNELLYWPLLEPNVARIMFTNGSVDPWSALSLAYRNGNDVNPNLSYEMIEGASHCADLHASQEYEGHPLAKARYKTSKNIESWLGYRH